MKYCKCGYELPSDYKYKKCEKCRQKDKEHIRQGFIAVGGVALSIVSVAAAIVTKGSVSTNSKK